MTTQLTGILEIDSERGVVYFHSNDPATIGKYKAEIVLRICKLPTPIPVNKQIDLTWGVGVNYIRQDKCPTLFSQEEMRELAGKSYSELYAEIRKWKDYYVEAFGMSSKLMARAESAEKDRDRAVYTLAKISKAILEYEVGDISNVRQNNS